MPLRESKVWLHETKINIRIRILSCSYAMTLLAIHYTVRNTALTLIFGGDFGTAFCASVMCVFWMV